MVDFAKYAPLALQIDEDLKEVLAARAAADAALTKAADTYEELGRQLKALTDARMLLRELPIPIPTPNADPFAATAVDLAVEESFHGV